MAARVLIVDDDLQFRRLAEGLLRRDGLEPAGMASNASEAIEIATREAFDAALVDVHLPDGTGLELTQRLKGEQTDLWIVLTSADPDAVTRVTAREAGAADFIAKTDLQAADLQALLDGHG